MRAMSVLGVGLVPVVVTMGMDTMAAAARARLVGLLVHYSAHVKLRYECSTEDSSFVFVFITACFDIKYFLFPLSFRYRVSVCQVVGSSQKLLINLINLVVWSCLVS